MLVWFDKLTTNETLTNSSWIIMNGLAPAISVRNLSVFYHSFCALSDISLDIPSGSLLAIAGPNGGGKTTFIKSILDLVPRSSGTILLHDRPFAYVRSRVAYIPQRMAVDWDFPASVLDVVLMGRYQHIGWFRAPSDDDKLKAYQALHQVGLSAQADHHISELSGGQQQRVFVARALVQDADIFLFDEPFIGIDSKTELLIVAILKSLAAQGKTVIVVHHDLQTLTDYFDSVLLLNGKKIAHGLVSQVCLPEYMCVAYGDRMIRETRSP